MGVLMTGRCFISIGCAISARCHISFDGEENPRETTLINLDTSWIYHEAYSVYIRPDYYSLPVNTVAMWRLPGEG